MGRFWVSSVVHTPNSGASGKILLDEERAIIDKAFQILDKDQSGAIDKGELEYVVKKLGCAPG